MKGQVSVTTRWLVKCGLQGCSKTASGKIGSNETVSKCVAILLGIDWIKEAGKWICPGCNHALKAMRNR